MENMKIFEELIKSAETMKKSMDKMLAKLDITCSQALILQYLSANRENKVTAKDIENKFSVSHATVSGIIDRMCKKGLLVTSQDEADKRCRIIEISEQAEKKYIKMHHANSFLNLIGERMSEEEQQSLIFLLDKFVKTVETGVEQYINSDKERIA